MADHNIKDEDIKITFLGLFGLNNEPFYIFGTLNGKPTLWKGRAYEVFTTEETGNRNHERREKLTKIDGQEVKWDYVSEGRAREVLSGQVPPEYIDRLVKGIPNYRPRSSNFDCLLITKADFIEKVQRYFIKMM